MAAIVGTKLYGTKIIFKCRYLASAWMETVGKVRCIKVNKSGFKK